MKSENEYIGDDKFKKFLEHYACPTPLSIVKMRVAGAICSPNGEIRPTDVISSLWENSQTPRLETKAEAELFFKFFMGLWDEMFRLVSQNDVVLPRIAPTADLTAVCTMRYDELELGFIEGFWGGLSELKIPAYIAKIVDSLSELAEVYKTLEQKIKPEQENKAVFDAIISCDKAANKSIHFIIEQYALPHIEEMKHSEHKGN
ncbi:MAG: hypothetical protein J6N45_08565 [Alphaproteobacteria bacterium]|nr:hypothetical protein [Alphaproteobacteria bacterium]